MYKILQTPHLSIGLKLSFSLTLTLLLFLQLLHPSSQYVHAQTTFFGPVVEEDFNASTAEIVAAGWWADSQGSTTLYDADIEGQDWGGVASGYHTKSVNGDRALGFYKSAPPHSAHITFRYTVIAQTLASVSGSFDFESTWIRFNDRDRYAGFKSNSNGAFSYRINDGEITQLLTTDDIGLLNGHQPGAPATTWLSDFQMDANNLSRRDIAFSLPSSTVLQAGDVVTFFWNAENVINNDEKNIQVNIDNFLLTGETVRWPTTLNLESALNPATEGQTVTFTATVQETVNGSPSGRVEFYDGVDLLGSGILNATGQASFSAGSLSIGDHSIRAEYLGDANFEGSLSQTINQTIQPRAPTTLSLSSSENPASLGQTVTLTATIQHSATGVPSGTVNFYDGTTLMGDAALDSMGNAVFRTDDLTPGPHLLTAEYLGDANFSPCTSSDFIQMIRWPVTISLISSQNPAGYHLPITFTATIFEEASQTPVGNMDFYDGAVLLGSSPIDTEGIAQFSTSTLGVGIHTITAHYPGNEIFEAGTSNSVPQSIEGPTDVDLASLEIVYHHRIIGVSWETINELELTGFNIYRSDADHPIPQKINPVEIQAIHMGAPEGGSYEYFDTTAAPGLEYQYWLEVGHESGSVIMKGPLAAFYSINLLPMIILP